MATVGGGGWWGAAGGGSGNGNGWWGWGMGKLGGAAGMGNCWQQLMVGVYMVGMVGGDGCMVGMESNIIYLISHG